MNLKEELLKALKIIPEPNRDMRTITIYCNPNFTHGSDTSIRIELEKILMDLENKNEVIQKRVKIGRTVKTIYCLV
jgi:hypothetical protein